MLQTKRLNDFSIIKELYTTRMKSDFARNELRPLSSLRKSWDHDEYDCFGLYDEEELLGYAFFVKNGKNYLLDYLAIEAAHRDLGYGSAFLRQLTIPDAECIIGEVEAPEKAADSAEKAQRERRVQFYLRNGYRQTGVTSRVFGADYRILEAPTGKWHSDGMIAGFYDQIYRQLLPAAFYRLNFKLT